ncbi:hypothetical protein [Sphingobacterium hotanense]|uniref:hypothetical protein n=1 Tax=Sphingobacterium hotanense TaxID=649196 RepID=UPI0011F1E797|nr:hypothetical protein [Sphingobacterium hotanense]
MDNSAKKEFDYKEIDTFEKVLQFKGETLAQFKARTAGMEVDTIGSEKVKAIAFAMNGGKHVTEVYYPWFYNPNRSFASFASGGFGHNGTEASVGTRHLIINWERADFAGKTFLKEYSQFINGADV